MSDPSGWIWAFLGIVGVGGLGVAIVYAANRWRHRRKDLAIEGRGDRNYINVFRAEKLRCLQESGEDSGYFAATAAGEQRDPRPRGVQPILRGKLLAAEVRRRHCGQRMADEFRGNAVLAIEALLERKDDQHLVHILAHALNAPRLPRPQLRADVIHHRHAQPAQFAGEAQIEFRKIDEHGDVGPSALGLIHHLAKAAIDIGDVLDHLDNADLGDLAGVHQQLASGSAHLLAAHAEARNAFAAAAR